MHFQHTFFVLLNLHSRFSISSHVLYFLPLVGPAPRNTSSDRQRAKLDMRDETATRGIFSSVNTSGIIFPVFIAKPFGYKRAGDCCSLVVTSAAGQVRVAFAWAILAQQFRDHSGRTVWGTSHLERTSEFITLFSIY
jgi:hypothetical protein